MDRGVEGARRDDLAVLGMRPSDLPDRATMRLKFVATTEELCSVQTFQKAVRTHADPVALSEAAPEYTVVGTLSQMQTILSLDAVATLRP